MESGAVVYSLAQEQDFLQVLQICSSRDYGGLDYMSAFFPRWLLEPGRVVLVGRLDDRVVALESALVVDGGQTVVFQGLRVVPDLRGRGVAGALQRQLSAYVRQRYPEVRAARLSRGEAPSADTLSCYRLFAKESILSMCCEAAHLGPFVSELGSKLAQRSDGSSDGPRTLTQEQAEALVLTPHVVSNLLPSRTIINDWEPLRPLEANLEVLRRRRLTWIVDRESEPAALSLGTPPYPVPYRHDAVRININAFGSSVPAVCAVFVAQLQALLPSVRGCLVLQTYVDPGVWSGLRQFCENKSNVVFIKDYWENFYLESDF